MTFRPLAFTAIAVLSGCATTTATSSSVPTAAATEQPQKSAPPAAESKPKEMNPEIAKLLQREFEPLPTHSVKVLGGKWTGQVEAKGEPTYTAGEDADELLIPVGGEEPIRCHLYHSGIDTAASLWNIADGIKKQYRIEPKGFPEVSVVAGSPLVQMEWLYMVPSPKGQSLGHLKAIAFPGHDLPMMCFHDEAGFSASFARVVKGLVASLSAAAGKDKAVRYRAVSVVKLGGKSVGFNTRRYTEGKNGRSVYVESTSMLLPTSPTDLQARDTFTVDVLDASRALLQRTRVVESNGEIETKVTLARDASGDGYTYDGTFKGKPVKGSLKASGPLSTEIGEAEAIAAQLLSGKTTELKFFEYSADQDPTAATEYIVRKDAVGPRAVTIESGPIQLKATVDAHGMEERSEFPIQGTTVTHERLFSEGAL